MKMYQILECKRFYDTIKEKKMPLKVAYKFSKLLKRLEEEATFYREEFSKIINEFGEIDENGEYILTEDGQGVRIKEGKLFECQEKMNELSEIEIVIDTIKFTLDELETLELNIAEVEWLMPFIEE